MGRGKTVVRTNPKKRRFQNKLLWGCVEEKIYIYTKKRNMDEFIYFIFVSIITFLGITTSNKFIIEIWRSLVFSDMYYISQY